MNADTIKLLGAVLGALFLGAGGASSYLVTRGESDCKAALAGAEARLDLTDKAMTSCEKALDLCSGSTTP